MSENEKVTLTDGSPVTPDHAELLPNGQQKGYIVLSPEERAKGFVRPVRTTYRHVGAPGPKYPLRDLSAEEKYAAPYVKFEEYPEGSAKLGRYWTQTQLDNVGKGCGVTTTMGIAIAETYAREPGFYGATYCCGCGSHLPVKEFEWTDGSGQRVGE